MRKLLLSTLLIFAFVAQSFAVNPDEVLDDPVLEQRARSLSTGIRCLVCQNQSIDDSDAELARDLRILVREKLVEGLTDREILDYLVERYGEFVLLKPRLNRQTLLLWAVPLLALLIGILFSFRLFSNAKKRSDKHVDKLSKNEKDKLSKILDK